MIAAFTVPGSASPPGARTLSIGSLLSRLSGSEGSPDAGSTDGPEASPAIVPRVETYPEAQRQIGTGLQLGPRPGVLRRVTGALFNGRRQLVEWNLGSAIGSAAPQPEPRSPDRPNPRRPGWGPHVEHDACDVAAIETGLDRADAKSGSVPAAASGRTRRRPPSWRPGASAMAGPRTGSTAICRPCRRAPSSALCHCQRRSALGRPMIVLRFPGPQPAARRLRAAR